MAKPMATPIHPSYKMDKDEQGKGVDETKYRDMINSLIYLTSFGPIYPLVLVCVQDFNHV